MIYLRLLCMLFLLFLLNSCNTEKDTGRVGPTVKPEKTAPAGTEKEEDKGLDGCEENLKIMGEALEEYAGAHNGLYPSSPEELPLKDIPVCPVCRKPYIYELHEKPDYYFVLKCGGENAHRDTGEVGEGNYPVYTIRYGLLLKGVMPGVNDSDYTGQAELSPPDVLRENYRAIKDRDFKKAYEFRSSKWKKKDSYERFYEVWSPNIDIALSDVEIISETDSIVKIKFRLYSEDRDTVSEEIYKAFYRGSVSLIKEDGEWKIDEIEAEKE